MSVWGNGISGLGEDPVGDLEAAAHRVVEPGVERVAPVLEARVDVRDVRTQIPGADGEGEQPDDHEREPPGGDVEHRQQRAVEHQRGADVRQQDEREHGHAPDHQHRTEVLERRQRHAEDPARAQHHHLSSVAQVAGQEDDQPDLGELRRLKAQPAGDLDLQVGPVDLLADAREAGEHEQDE
jgi:hypothetical protein